MLSLPASSPPQFGLAGFGVCYGLVEAVYGKMTNRNLPNGDERHG